MSSEFGDFSFQAPGDGDTLGELIDAINLSTVSTGLSAEYDADADQLVISSYTGDEIQLSGFSTISTGADAGDYSTPESDGFSAVEASFDIVQTQGGDTAVVQVTALYRDDMLPGDNYVDGVKELTTVATADFGGSATVDTLLATGSYIFEIDLGDGVQTYQFDANGGDDIQDLVAYINSQTAETGVTAAFIYGELVLAPGVR